MLLSVVQEESAVFTSQAAWNHAALCKSEELNLFPPVFFFFILTLLFYSSVMTESISLLVFRSLSADEYKDFLEQREEKLKADAAAAAAAAAEAASSKKK